MEITVDNVMGAVPIAVIAIQGDLDASNFMELITRAQKSYQSGIRNILLDLTHTPFISSAGLVAMHTISLLLRGEQTPSGEDGWGAIHAMHSHFSKGMQEHIKLLNPQPRVVRTLERTGLKDTFSIFTDRETALASFKEESAQTPTE